MVIYYIMLAILHFKSVLEMIIFYAGAFILFSIPAYYFYKKSVKSRKIYKCPNCNEIYRVEHMESTCCKVCGSQVQEITDNNE